MKGWYRYTRGKIFGTIIGSILFFAAAALVNESYFTSAGTVNESYLLSNDNDFDFELNPGPGDSPQKTDSQSLSPRLKMPKKNTPVKKHKRYQGCIASQIC